MYNVCEQGVSMGGVNTIYENKKKGESMGGDDGRC